MVSTGSQGRSSPPTAVVLHLAGELDLARVPDFRARLARAAAASPDAVVVDLSAVTFMGCSGMRPLLEAHATLGCRLRLRGVPPLVTQLFRLTGLEDMFSRHIDPALLPA